MRLLRLIESLPDPRMQGKVKHSLSSIVFTTLCGVLSGCESWEDIEDYCEIKLKWLSKYVSFLNGVPSSCTFRRIFMIVNPNLIEELLRSHANEIVSQNKATDQISIDGKALKGSKTLEFKCLTSVSAWCHENGIVLGEEQVSKKSNEIASIPKLLEIIDVKGNTISIDAAGCQKTIVKMIREMDGHYVLGLKANHKKLYDEVRNHIDIIGENNDNRLHDAFEKKHGRTVRRRYFGYNISNLPEAKEWVDAKTVIAVESISSKDNDPNRKVTAEWRYFLSNHDCYDKKLPVYIRNHWGIENKLHWILDVHLKEDNDQKTERKSARNFALLRRIALNIVRTKDKNSKRSMKRKLKRSGWDNDYLLSLLK